MYLLHDRCVHVVGNHSVLGLHPDFAGAGFCAPTDLQVEVTLRGATSGKERKKTEKLKQCRRKQVSNLDWTALKVTECIIIESLGIGLLVEGFYFYFLKIN